ncbi:sigma-70 family RNA polymerase sigma factor [Acetatifactor muris]|uniref:RNA polymerase sigma-E factor n=1 Tax=Acetatifactor muris TaxID=879566 RepID=A0A2K4ZNY0_9FIRM|nr:sigma-70 family RNA polymerase sigma factor [Acetatifactor muris]MCR2050632.1 sigma-70 family RNA polymerase sigma factor [Acetatifactor muris]SOY32181.1 RNA polymerase sigma-E factor precursor [Acetatifactor muris]
MKQNIPLTSEQQKLVETHLYIVNWVMSESIHVHKNIYGFEYEDLYQEGCIWLCYAATTYNPERSQFSTYAKRIVCNGLFSYCRQMHSRQSHFTYFAVDKQGNLLANGEPYVLVDDFDIQINMIETLDLLASAEKKYQGVTKLGIEALKLKLKGMSVSEIADLYHVPPPHVGAWISRATQKLRKDTPFLSGLL